MLDPQIGDIATWLATIVAIISALTAYRASTAADKHQEEAANYTKRSAELLEKKHQLELRAWTDQYFNSVRSWGEQVCSAMAEATHLAELNDISDEMRLPVLIRLSTLIDTGRWYFPNQWTDDYGIHKEFAYRGVRQPILKNIVVAYDEVKNKPLQVGAKERILIAKREFVSHVQIVLDPRTRDQEIKKVLSEFEASERLRNAP